MRKLLFMFVIIHWAWQVGHFQNANQKMMINKKTTNSSSLAAHFMSSLFLNQTKKFNHTHYAQLKSMGPDGNKFKCKYNPQLYKRMFGLVKGEKGKKGDDLPKKECQQQGCFYIFEQEGLGWKNWAPSLATTKHPNGGDIMGCIYDIPFLLERTHASSDMQLHKIIKMLRACFIGETIDEKLPVCQPDGSLAATNMPDPPIPDQHYPPQGQPRSFYKFAQGIMFVKAGKKELIVCCDPEANHGSQSTPSIENKCKEATNFIAKTENWRNDW